MFGCPKLNVCDLHEGLRTCWLPSVTTCSLASKASPGSNNISTSTMLNSRLNICINCWGGL